MSDGHRARLRSEREHLLARTEEEVTAGRDLALATIVSTRGSTYRHAGARLLIREDGSWTGNLSGGCLEGEVLDVGIQVLDEGRPRYVEYDLTADEEAIWGWGLGCNGAIDVLVETGATAREAVAMLRAGDASRRPYVLVTGVTGDAAGRHLLVLEDGATAGELGVAGVDAVVAAARRALDEERGPVRREVAGIDVLLEVSRPPLRLVVCGAGHDAVPLVQFGARLGWHVLVVDDRSTFLDPDRFPDAAQLIRTDPERMAEAVTLDELTYVVVMSHNFLRDVGYLSSLGESDVAYVGTLGPARRLERLLEHVAREGHPVSDRVRARIHGPAGLDLGAEGPDEIAWSVCSEILAVSRRHAAGFLRDRSGSIHEPSLG